jgi:hypothetical protein
MLDNGRALAGGGLDNGVRGAEGGPGKGRRDLRQMAKGRRASGGGPGKDGEGGRVRE